MWLLYTCIWTQPPTPRHPTAPHRTQRRRYPGKSVLGAGVIFLGACASMFLPISRLVEAKAAQNDAARSHEYVPEHLRGGNGDYAIVEGG